MVKLGNVALLLTLGLGSSPGQELVDPFGETITPEQEAIHAAPNTWEVMGEVFSLPFAEAAKLQRGFKDPAKLYAEMLKRVEAKSAALEELVILKGLFFEKTELRSVEEYIYPTEFDPPEVPLKVAELPENPELAKLFMTPSTPTAFEFADLGVTLELTIEGKETPDTILAMVDFSLVTLLGRDPWGKDQAKTEMPHFAEQELKARLRVKRESTTLVGSISPPTAMQAEEGEREVWLAYVTVSEAKE